MEPFRIHEGRVALLDWTDVNTDLIIPARYLKRIERTGYGPLLFADKRYVPGGAPPVDAPEQHGPLDPAFPLNAPEFHEASVLVVGRNFGCGSSREHAVWAVRQAGYRVLIAPGLGEGFADIFEGNAYNNGLLPIELPDPDWRAIVAVIRDATGPVQARVDLEAQTIHLADPTGSRLIRGFAVPESQRQRLLQGLDAIGETLLHAEAIAGYERTAPPWAAAPGG
jgi:3-isopropylmalate/(R)-2-methylmalate dehydratase small subunit